MSELLNKLIIRLCRDSWKNHVPLGQVRATKLIYLIEWDFYAWHRKRLTELDWCYLHYGPWSSILSDTLEEDFHAPTETFEGGTFKPVKWVPPEVENVSTKFDIYLEPFVQRVLEHFGPKNTEEIIRYVYFHTEPMLSAERGQQLDFEVIQKRAKPINPVSLLDKKTISEMRNRILTAMDDDMQKDEKEVGNIPPELYAELLESSKSGNINIPEGEIIVNSSLLKNIKDEG